MDIGMLPGMLSLQIQSLNDYLPTSILTDAMISYNLVHIIRTAGYPKAARLKRWLSRLLPYRHVQVTSGGWDAQYVNGRWNYLRQIDELAHYGVITSYCHYLKQAGTILDLGCGEGILQERLNSGNYSRYVGVDISSEAIQRASHKQDERTVFVLADASSYNPDEQFDIVVFNECLYYFENPLGIVRRYERFLREDGAFIVSMYVDEQNMRIWKMLEALYTAEDEVRVSNKSGVFVDYQSV